MQTTSVVLGTPVGVQLAAVLQVPPAGPFHVFVQGACADADAGRASAAARTSGSARITRI
jgi:hypothetical protein